MRSANALGMKMMRNDPKRRGVLSFIAVVPPLTGGPSSSRKLEQESGHNPIPATVLGGSGFLLGKGEAVLISCKPGLVLLSNPHSHETQEFKVQDLLNIEITGPGTEHTSAGMIGGGFGVEGMLKGILVNTVRFES